MTRFTLPAVTPAEILAELEKLATRLGVTVRVEAFDAKSTAKGGLCKLRGVPFVMIDARLPVMDRIGVLSDALATFDLEAIYVPPVVRARLERRRRGRGPVMPLLRPVARARWRDAR